MNTVVRSKVWQKMGDWHRVGHSGGDFYQHHHPCRPVMILAFFLCLFAISPLAMGRAQARGTPDGFADLAESLSPAVVNIATTQTIAAKAAPGDDNGGMLKPFPDKPAPPKKAGRKVTSLGSGFLIDPDGYVVTNNHVIENADEITVILPDNTSLVATLVGRDTKLDLALLKVEAKRRLPALTWGDSNKARVGDWVLAIGNPFGLGGSVTAGIISAKTRDINAGPYDNFIQTDAAINRGNSGGPLFNMEGAVIGINTAIYSPEGGSVGISFAIPTSVAQQAIADLRTFGHTRRGWVGWRLQAITTEIADSLGLASTAGGMVAGFDPNSPAALAGFLAGDVVLEYDGVVVSDVRRLPGMIAETGIGRKVSVVVWRNGGRKSLELTIQEVKDTSGAGPGIAGAAPETTVIDPSPPVAQPPVPTAGAALGLTAVPLESRARKLAKLPVEAKGLMITEVKPRGPAADKDIRVNELIVDAASKPVGTPAEFNDTVRRERAAGHKTILLLIQNGTSQRFVAVTIGDP